jgi:GDPmannose 4,6-dehydratase
LLGKDWHSYVKEKKNFEAEYRKLVSNPATINSLGWYATTRINELAAIMVNYKNEM